jgi:hypothetical protein
LQGFTAVTASALLISTYLSLSWLIRSRKAAAMAQALPPAAAEAAAGEGAVANTANQQHQQQHLQQQQDRLVFVLPACLLLLLWTSSSRLAQYDHPVILSSTVLYCCVSVLPELVVAAVMAVPTLAARVALGGRYGGWLKLQQRKGSKAGNISNSSNSSGSSISSDAEVGLPSGVQMATK